MSKLGKVAGGVGLIGVSLYILVSDGLAVTSMGAVVNARVSVVRAPIDGMLDLVPRPIGGHIRAGEPLGSITDERADDARLLDLERAAAAIESDIGRLRSQIESIRHSRAELQRQAAAYNEGRTRQLKARIEETRALLSAAKARAKESVSALSRAEKLRQQGVQSVALMEKAQADRDVNSLDAEAASARLEGLRIELDAAMRGTFLGDSYNDVPYSSQRTQELELRAAELTAELQERDQRLKNLRDQIAVERQRIAKLREAMLASPVNGRIWEAPLGNGEYARKGQDLLRLLDCSTTIVTAGVGESDYNLLKVGDPARFRLSGTTGTFEGIVLRLAGSGAATVYNNLAIAPGLEHLKRYDVALFFPGLLDDPDAACAVGRTGKVVFSGASPDFWRSIKSRFGFL